MFEMKGPHDVGTEGMKERERNIGLEAQKLLHLHCRPFCSGSTRSSVASRVRVGPRTAGSCCCSSASRRGWRRTRHDSSPAAELHLKSWIDALMTSARLLSQFWKGFVVVRNYQFFTHWDSSGLKGKFATHATQGNSPHTRGHTRCSDRCLVIR